ncbi:MAG TPA: fructosamine kinase family protein [Steroidobacteraceae bacterium]|nr:fructosamine kinase family protein [Steroidobacteraceae bacterium]
MNAVAAALTAELGAALEARPSARVHGGCINESYRWEGAAGPLFVKVAEAGRLGMLQAEADGLRELQRVAAVRTPRVLAVGSAGEKAYLALEWIELRSSSSSADALLGLQLARQHRAYASAFGWHRDNTIGSSTQPNTWCEDWVEFFRERRLRHQLELARRSGRDAAGRLQRRGAELLERMGAFFGRHAPLASLLHGDLWSGNRAADAQAAPVVFDPAVYYGDREADIAMTRLFGAFSPDFYAAYQAEWPLDAEAPRRVELYNLYHVLNHLNLFGGAYLTQARGMIDRLLVELGH